METRSKIREENFSIIRRWQSSGLSQVKFCEGEQISFHRFYYWYKKFRAGDRDLPGSFVQLKPDQFLPVDHRPHTEVCFANGNRIVFHGEVNIARLRRLAG